MTVDRPLRVALVAGEASGDQLGAGVIRNLRSRLGDRLVCGGVAGPAMQAEGCDAWFSSDDLAVMGLVEVVAHLPRLLRLRRRLRQRLLRERPDVFVGIDAPDFNLGLEKQLRRNGLTTVHYVSPSVWAWRPKRAAAMSRSTDRVLCLLPFEPAFYERYGVRAEFVGHPLADAMPMRTAPDQARAACGLAVDAEVVAVLPGSRGGEMRRLGPDFVKTMALLAQQRPGIRFVAPMATPALREKFAALLALHAPAADVNLLDRQAQQAIAAADVVLVASGTATLEALLMKRPMVVAYRVAPLTRVLLERLRLLTVDRFALPNLLAGKDLVPEILQDDVTPERLAEEVTALLDDTGNRELWVTECDEIHNTLRRHADARAADAIMTAAGR